VIRALVVAYYFPPMGGAGTQRFAKFCKYLPEHGVEPLVLSAGKGLRNENAPHDDPTLLAGAGVHVERVDAPARAPLRRWVQRRLRFSLDEDEWADAATERALSLVRVAAPDVVVTTLSPYSVYRLGERLRRECGLPWVLDLRDPWSLDGWRSYCSALHAGWDLRHMRRALCSADFVIANVPAAAAAFVGLGVDPARTLVLPNGYDEDDFVGPRAEAPPPDGRFRLVHLGTFHPADVAPGFTRNTLLRHRHRQIEQLGRTGHYLLHAIALLRQRSPGVYRRLGLHLFGNVDATHRELADRLGVGDCLTVHGYVPHREAIAALCSADAVFVPLHGVPDGERALVVPGKLYEALASERTVLAALPPGDGADLVRRLAAGVVVPPTDAGALCETLGALVEAHARGEPRRGCRRTALQAFSRRALTNLLAQVLDAAAKRRPLDGWTDPFRAISAAIG